MSGARSEKNTLRVVELFAGVGGFRMGFDRASAKTRAGRYETVWASQWEPASGKNQHAAWVYEHVFFRSNGITDENVIRRSFSNEDINVVTQPDRVDEIPDHDVLCGGFPCQDYSVARPKNQAAGIEGKKGVLWWSIDRILQRKINKGRPVSYVFLENVDRLLKSPASRRGRDFAIILARLNELGYSVEWRVVNAGEYGLPQRRRRTFILGYYKDTPLDRALRNAKNELSWLTREGLLARAFKAEAVVGKGGGFRIQKDPVEITKDFRLCDHERGVDVSAPFENCGLMVDGYVHTQKVSPVHTDASTTLGDVIRGTKAKDIDERFYIPKKEVKKWEGQKAAHDFIRTSKSGHEYRYKEGPIPFPDRLDRASRTIITSEGGRSPSRFKHIVPAKRTIAGKTYEYRRLTPEELEALCMFDRGHTKYMTVPRKNEPVETPDTKRAFFMGNALVVGVIERIGEVLLKAHVGASATKTRSAARRAKATA